MFASSQEFDFAPNLNRLVSIPEPNMQKKKKKITYVIEDVRII